MLILKLALRNIFRNKRRSLFTILTIFGGFVLSSLSIGWSDGSYSNIINLFTRNRLGHIQIHTGDYLYKPSLYKNIDNYESLGNKLESVKGVIDWAPRIYSSGLASVKNKSTGARIIGINPEKENNATRFDNKIVEGKGFDKGTDKTVLIGSDLAVVLKADVGDDVVLVSQGADGSIANDRYRITGFVKTGDKGTDRTAVYTSLADAQELLCLYGRAHEMAVIVDNVRNVKKIAGKIREKLNNDSVSVEPWQEFARSFYQAMKADQQGMWISLFVIAVIVAVGVLNTILMAVLERTREYGLLKAVGTRPFQVAVMIVLESNFLALISIVFGSIAALGLNYYLSLHGIALPASMTYGGVVFDTLLSEVNFRSFYIPAATVFGSTAIVSILPAIKAARADPAKSMRMH